MAKDAELNYAEKMTQTDLFQPNFPVVSINFLLSAFKLDNLQ